MDDDEVWRKVEILLLLEGDRSDMEDDSDDGLDERESMRKLQDSPLNEGVCDKEEAIGEISDYLGVPVDVTSWHHPIFPSDNEPSTLQWTSQDVETFDTTFIEDTAAEPSKLTPIEYFNRLFDNDMINHIANQTNIYSTTRDANVYTSSSEIQKFLGVTAVIGISRASDYNILWHKLFGMTSLPKIMPLERYETLRKYIHFNDNTGMILKGNPGYDSLFKLRPLITSLRNNMSKLKQEEYNNISENILPFIENHQFGRDTRREGRSCGIKVYSRVGVSGMVYDFEVYDGNTNAFSQLCERIPQSKNLKLSFRKELASLKLMHDLKNRGILVVSEVNDEFLSGADLKSDAVLKQEGLGSCDLKYETNLKLIAVKCNIINIKYYISTYAGNLRGDSANHPPNTDVYPSVVMESVKFLEGIKTYKKGLRLHRNDYRSKRLYLNVFFHLIEVCIMNAWLMYKFDHNRRGEECEDYWDFRTTLGELLTGYNPPEEPVEEVDDISDESEGHDSEDDVRML